MGKAGLITTVAIVTATSKGRQGQHEGESEGIRLDEGVTQAKGKEERQR